MGVKTGSPFRNEFFTSLSREGNLASQKFSLSFLILESPCATVVSLFPLP